MLIHQDTNTPKVEVNTKSHYTCYEAEEELTCSFSSESAGLCRCLLQSDPILSINVHNTNTICTQSANQINHQFHRPIFYAAPYLARNKQSDSKRQNDGSGDSEPAQLQH